MGNSIKVGDSYRTNPLSLKPGGSTVTVYYSDGSSRIYDKIKYTRRYIGSLSMKEDAGDVVKIEVDGELFWQRTEDDHLFY